MGKCKSFHIILYTFIFKTCPSYYPSVSCDRIQTKFLLVENEDLVRETVGKLESFLNVNFTSIARQLAKTTTVPSQIPASSIIPNPAMSDLIPPNVKYIYFNSLNLAEKASPTIRCEIDAYKLLADLRADLARCTIKRQHCL